MRSKTSRADVSAPYTLQHFSRKEFMQCITKGPSCGVIKVLPKSAFVNTLYESFKRNKKEGTHMRRTACEVVSSS